MQKQLFDLILHYTSWLRGYRTTLGLLSYCVAFLAALATGDPAIILAAFAALWGAFWQTLGLRPEPGDGQPPLPPGEQWVPLP
jgi:hypothetical protein